MKQLRLKITGMTCAACSGSIERSFRRKSYIDKIEVDLINGSAFIIYDEKTANIDDIIKHIQKLGYGAEILKNSQKKDSSYNNDYLIAIIFAIPLFLISMGSMFLHLHNEILICLIEIILLLPILYAGRNIYKKGFLSLLNLVPNMDSLVMLGSGSAILYSLYMIILYILNINQELLHSIYFESAGVIIAVIMLGKRLEHKATDNAKTGLKDLINLLPKTTLVLQNNNIVEKNIKDICINDIIVIPKGAMVSLDGILINNECKVDESLITGESKHKRKQKGDIILSGSINQNEQFMLKVVALEEDSMIGKIINLMQGIKKAPIARIADIVSAYFVPIVIFISIIGALAWFIYRGDFHFSFIVLTSTLLISCPCALGLATPLSILVATNKASQNAIYFKSGESLEKTSKINIVVFDKTGTLTKGELEVIDFVLKENNSFSKEQILSLSNALEKASEHLIAKAIIKYISKIPNINNELKSNDVKTSVGLGISGMVENHLIKIGNAEFIGLDKDSLIVSKHTLAYISIDGIYCGAFIIADSLRENAKILISNLKSLGIKSIILSGDSKDSVSSVASLCGIDEFYYSQLPNDKLNYITNLQKENNKVAFIGDGINDALAISKADIGISLSLANDIAIKQADIILLSTDLNSLYRAIVLSKKTLKNIKENLAFAFIYNICAIPIALGIPYLFNINLALNPMIAGIAMGLSSISVVLNSLRLNRAI
ncbi:hypothetical protein CCY99_00460 [Helicobacter sp. 16-1353]|uniref:heavy metal translocating P-type ATPase n=1 Tax=Helicobacter sp. 16-1353 TaxID=2004996 RepID=UPI000DCBFE25|nr:cation-translocating P-type ATPase [Helicobacter sp. 16-1353]RAX55204.1 hypothetical protein CCY99_00460 [Helicobacter sp. 16-1353]